MVARRSLVLAVWSRPFASGNDRLCHLLKFRRCMLREGWPQPISLMYPRPLYHPPTVAAALFLRHYQHKPFGGYPSIHLHRSRTRRAKSALALGSAGGTNQRTWEAVALDVRLADPYFKAKAREEFIGTASVVRHIHPPGLHDRFECMGCHHWQRQAR